jgi:Secretion system C-terminal sorting domain
MVRRLKQLFILILLIGSGISEKHAGLYAQQDSIIISHYGLTGLPDTVAAGDSLIAGGFLKNEHAAYLYSDSIQIVGYIDTGSVFIPFAIPPFDSIYIPPGDSIFILIPFQFRTPSTGGPFKIGGNTIVIWPAAINSSWTSYDHFQVDVVILDTTTGVPFIPPHLENVRLYPVPSSGPLYVLTDSPQFNAIEGTVYDNNGRMIFTTKNMSNGIDMSLWPIGTYFIDVTFDNGWRKTYKIVRE